VEHFDISSATPSVDELNFCPQVGPMNGETPSVDDSNAAVADYDMGAICSRSVATDVCIPVSVDAVPVWPLAPEICHALPGVHALNRCSSHRALLDRHMCAHSNMMRRLSYEGSCWRAVDVDEDGLEHSQDWESALLTFVRSYATTFDDSPPFSCKIAARLDMALLAGRVA